MNRYRFTSIIAIFILFLLSPLVLLAQQEKMLNTYADQLGFKFDAPKGYSLTEEARTIYFHDQRKGKWLPPFTYSLHSCTDDILIGIIFLNLKYVNDSTELVKKLFPGRSRNTEYLLAIKNKADTTNGNGPKAFSKEELEKYSNADAAGIYDFIPEIPYLNMYNLCKVMYLHKQDRGDIEVFYFYTRENRDKIEKILKDTQSMIRFL